MHSIFHMGFGSAAPKPNADILSTMKPEWHLKEGELRIEALDRDGNVIAPFTHQNCAPLLGPRPWHARMARRVDRRRRERLPSPGVPLPPDGNGAIVHRMTWPLMGGWIEEQELRLIQPAAVAVH